VPRQDVVLSVRYFLGVAFLAVLFYSSYKTKPATFSFIDHAMVFFTMALALIILTVLTDPKKDAVFKDRVRYWGLGTALGVYIYGVYANGPFCVFFTAYVDWASLISCTGILLLSIVLMNAWCRYLCPEGTALGLMCNHAAWQINRTDACCECLDCEAACPLDCITVGIRDRRTCIFCMRCVDACESNALRVENEVATGRRQTLKYHHRPAK